MSTIEVIGAGWGRTGQHHIKGGIGGAWLSHLPRLCGHRTWSRWIWERVLCHALLLQFSSSDTLLIFVYDVSLEEFQN
jgi:hypothetical protein